MDGCTEITYLNTVLILTFLLLLHLFLCFGVALLAYACIPLLLIRPNNSYHYIMTEASLPSSPPPSASSSLISPAFQSLEFCQTMAAKSLRVCCFGSSSSQTPVAYLRPSAEVGYLLAVRGHVCVNGAGSFGCMSALNEGAVAGNGHIVGVIHEMWLKEGEDVKKKNAWGLQRPLRDGGAHAAFADLGTTRASPNQDSATSSSHQGPIRELLVAGGKDLQQRKKMLLENADALGTFRVYGNYTVVKVESHFVFGSCHAWWAGNIRRGTFQE